MPEDWTPEERLEWAEKDLQEADSDFKKAQARLDDASDDWQWAYNEVQRLKQAVQDAQRDRLTG